MAIPNVTARSGGQQTTDTTSHVITLPSFSVGQLLLVVIAIDGRVRFTIGSGSGWNMVGRNPNGITSLGVFWKIATGSGDNLTLTSDSAQQSVHNSWAISGGYYVDGDPGQRTDGNVYNHYPVDNLGDYLGIIGQAANGVVTIAAPSTGGWANSVLRTPSGTASATLFTCEAPYSNTYIAPAAATFTGAGYPLVYNVPTFTLAVSEVDPFATGHPRVFSREVTDLSFTTQTSHPINMPPNIEVGDLLITYFSAYGNTTVSVDTAASGPYWREDDGDQNHVTVTSGVYFKTAQATNALTLTTGVATKSHALTVCIKNWSRVIESSSPTVNYVKGNGTYDHPDILLAPTRKKILMLRAFSIANSYWYGAGQNYWTGFPFSASGNGASICYGENGSGLFKTYNYGSYGYPAENWITWYYAVEGKHMMPVDFVGWRILTFAGTSTGQSMTLSTVTDQNSASVSVRTGDLVIFGFSTASTVDRTTGASNLAITSSGWTLIDQKRYVNGSTYDVNMVMYYKVMGDTPDSTINFTGSFSNQDAGAATIYVFRGCDPINPIDNVTWTSATGNNLPQPLPLDFNQSGSYPMAYVAQAAANTGTLVPDLTNASNNWYYISSNQTDTNSINTTMNYGLPENLKRVVPAVYSGGSNAYSAGNSWGAYTLAIKPRSNPNTFTWTHEAGTRANIAYFSTSQVGYVSQVGQKGSVSARIAPNNYQSLIYTDQIDAQKFWIQARVNIVVTQNPTANSIISLFGLHSYVDMANSWTNFVAQAEIKTNGQIYFSLFHGANNLTIPANTAFASNTWNYIAMVADYSTQRENQMIFKVNNANIGSANIFSALWKPHVLAGRTTEQSGSSNWNGFVYIDNMQYSTTDWPTYPTGRPKIYNGSTWVNKPLKRWNGSAWVEEPIYYYNGTNFEFVN